MRDEDIMVVPKASYKPIQIRPITILEFRTVTCLITLRIFNHIWRDGDLIHSFGYRSGAMRKLIYFVPGPHLLCNNSSTTNSPMVTSNDLFLVLLV